eukprot:1036812-Rhodomonas_salina.1
MRQSEAAPRGGPRRSPHRGSAEARKRGKRKRDVAEISITLSSPHKNLLIIKCIKINESMQIGAHGQSSSQDLR